MLRLQFFSLIFLVSSSLSMCTLKRDFPMQWLVTSGICLVEVSEFPHWLQTCNGAKKLRAPVNASSWLNVYFLGIFVFPLPCIHEISKCHDYWRQNMLSGGIGATPYNGAKKLKAIVLFGARECSTNWWTNTSPDILFVPLIIACGNLA